jgi:uncharacterized protein (DUF885 family)
VNQINGPLIDIPGGLQNQHQIVDLASAQDYNKRLAGFKAMVDSVAAKLSQDVKQNWIAPKTNLEGAINYLNNFLAPAASEHPLVSNLENKLAKLNNITPQQKQALIADAQQLVAEVVYPAYSQIRSQVSALLPLARQESGIWAQPNGDKYYQDAILQLADSKLTAEQIHQIGLDEVARINGEMDAILQQQGYNQGTPGQRMAALNEEQRFLYEDSDQGRAQLLKDLNGYIDEITAKMASTFPTKPKYQVEVRAFPKEVQDGAAGGQYTSPSLDGSKPGIYWINLKDMKANPSYGLKTLTYHEANPGHHWQVALNLEQDALPFLRRIAPYSCFAPFAWW